VSVEVSAQTVAVRAWSNFLRAHAALRRQFDRELVTEHGLTISDFEVLYRLSVAPGKMLRRVDLAEHVLLTPSGITRLLDGLESGGFVKKGACATDARVVYAQLTDKGQRRFTAAADSHLSSVRALFGERFSDDELETLAGLLERLPQAPIACDAEDAED
jgi:DNA-binding MarR family transcriptional regulator